MTTEEIKTLYGSDVRISHVEDFKLVHLDNPTTELMERRAHEFNPSTYFTGDCPLCQQVRKSGLVVYDDRDPDFLKEEN